MSCEAKERNTHGHVEIVLPPHLTCVDLERELTRATSEIAQAKRPVGLLVDCRKMQDYETDTRRMFIDWNASQRDKVRSVALVTAKASLRVVIGAMAMSSGQKMKMFDDLQTAQTWASQLQ